MPSLRLQYRALVASLIAWGATPLVGAPSGGRVDIRGGPLPAALAELARETGTELLFDANLVRRLGARPLRGRMTPRDALARLLAGTGVGFREARGTFILFLLPPSAPSNADQDPPVAEILVTGRRTQNADIRRTRNDIQPYKVMSSRDIEGAHRDNLDELMRSREPANAQIASPAQLLEIGGDTRSAIDLRGLGTERTLILVDGRRLPSFPTRRFDFFQPDVNALPLGTIDRIETLTGTAGGIYGPSALGGVVNVILKHDYEGADLRATAGVTSRGDAETRGIEGRLGFTLFDGRTSVMLAGGARTSEPLRRGDRDYLLRQRLLQYSNDPAGYLRQRATPTAQAQIPRSNSVSVFTTNGSPLTFDAAYGGGDLGASFSFLPIGFTGTPEQAIELLRQNAGRLVFEPPDDLAGSRRFMHAAPSTASALLNIRHSFSDRVEAYLDGLWLRNKGALEYAEAEQVVTLPDAPNNPFAQIVFFTVPRPDLTGSYRQKVETRRLTAGLIVRLPHEWSANADFSTGSTSVRRSLEASIVNFDVIKALQTGAPGRPGLPVLAPLGSWPEFVSALDAYRETYSLDEPLKNRFDNAALRLAGPLLPLPGGTMTATGLLEWRREHVPASDRTIRFSDRTVTSPASEKTQSVTSAYVELRAPLTDSDLLPVVRNLELQLALRYDRAVTAYPDGFGVVLDGEEVPTRSSREALTYTAGAKFLPTPFLMLRGSVATGELPPTIDSLRSSADFYRTQDPALADPQRGGRPIGSERSFRFLYGGSPDSRPERARTVSIGAVLNPSGRRGPRVSLDFSEIRKQREPYALSFLFFDRDTSLTRIPAIFANGQAEPGRIVRLPLTDADRARGFTGGIVAALDGRGINRGESRLKVLDLQLDWFLPTEGAGDFRLYGAATWLPSLRRRASKDDPWIQFSGSADGPLEWRGNGGVDWTNGNLTLGFNAQYFGAYRPTYSAPPMVTFNSQIERFQGGRRIPAQFYLELGLRRRLQFRHADLGRGTFDIGFAVVNLLDKSPPITGNLQTPGYSYYGDPRRRRFELTLTSAF